MLPHIASRETSLAGSVFMITDGFFLEPIGDGQLRVDIVHELNLHTNDVFRLSGHRGVEFDGWAETFVFPTVEVRESQLGEIRNP